ncbi:MAG: hypothetical protein JWM28_4496 [Chitinophagaceae bacterium]|nr:hypothetical protein [Chitinophagaceae bacterium]
MESGTKYDKYLSYIIPTFFMLMFIEFIVIVGTCIYLILNH